MTRAYDLCRTCGRFGWLDTHTCPPTWEVELDGEGSWRTVHARDAEEAAEVAAERSDSDGEYSIIRNGSAQALVRRTELDEPEAYFIEAESRPHYTASRSS